MNANLFIFEKLIILLISIKFDVIHYSQIIFELFAYICVISGYKLIISRFDIALSRFFLIYFFNAHCILFKGRLS